MLNYSILHKTYTACKEAMLKKIILTGGGTAGHVTPNIALLPHLKAAGYEISYIGSYDGIEKKLIEDFGIPYYGISTGKFRRYLDPKNFTDPFRVIKGYSEARKIMKKLRPDVIFSKSRIRDVADARQIIMYLSQRLTSLSSSSIGHKLNRSHTTVLHGIKAVEDRVNFTKDLQDAVMAIEEDLKK